MSASNPVGLPEPLGDPLRSVRRFIGWLFLALTVVPLGLILILVLADVARIQGLEDPGFSRVSDQLYGGDPTASATTSYMQWSSFIPLAVVPMLPAGPLIFIWLILPGRATNAMYLRSFRNDRQTGLIRRSAQQALGPGFRLSGIRDPRRRRSLLDYLGLLVFILRYSTPKYMNLEGGKDWKCRLWRSLGDSRCVLIDVSDFTPFVQEEIDLCYHCVGLERMLFIGDLTRSVKQWQQEISARLPAPTVDPGEIRVAAWDPARGNIRSEFQRTIKQFVASLPQRPPGVRHEHLELAKTESHLTGDAAMNTNWKMLGTQALAVLIGIGVTYCLATLDPAIGSPLSVVIGCVFFAFLGWSIVTYLMDSTRRQRRIATMSLLGMAAFYYVVNANLLQFVAGEPASEMFESIPPINPEDPLPSLQELDRRNWTAP